MCQILALSANAPTDISFSFEGFVNRAGITDTNVDGTGIAFFEDENSVRIFKDEKPALNSFVRSLVKLYHIKSQSIIAHIRRASQGEPKLINCHPFVRELWGQNWVFAHNGHVSHFPNLRESTKLKRIGETDSELFFLHLLDELQDRFEEMPCPKVLFSTILEICDQYADYGILNFCLSNGSLMFAHCSTNLFYTTRDNNLQDKYVTRIDDGGLLNLSCYASEQDLVTLICTIPVTNEYWQALENGQLVLFENGKILCNQQGKPSCIDEHFAALTGISSSVEQRVKRQQAYFKLRETLNKRKSVFPSSK